MARHCRQRSCEGEQRATPVRECVLIGGNDDGSARDDDDADNNDEPTTPGVADHLVEVDWVEVATAVEDEDRPDFLVEPVLVYRAQHQVYAPAKEGKSLLLLWLAASLATGRKVLDRPAGDPVDVLVLDHENTPEDDVWPRLEEMGFKRDELAHFHFYSFPLMPGLDTKAGAAVLEALCERHHPAFVLLESFARVVEGAENESDTVRAYYANAGLVLKRRGITAARTDNTGHDTTKKAARGSSGKNDDVDVSWRVIRRDDGVQLRRDLQRRRVLAETVDLHQVEEPHLHFTLAPETYPATEQREVLDHCSTSTASDRRHQYEERDAGAPRSW